MKKEKLGEKGKSQNPVTFKNHPPLGAHTSIAGGIYNAILQGQEIEADVVQIFAKNQMQWQWREYTEEELERYFGAIRETGVRPVSVHSAYLINLATDQPQTWEKSFAAIKDELRRTEILQIPYLVLHPGSHLGKGEDHGLRRVAESLRHAYEEVAAPTVTVLLETTAGQGTNLGYRFEHLRDIMDYSGIANRLAVCLDTCHVFAAGFDLRTAEGWEDMKAAFDEILGWEKLKLIHLNDSRQPVGSRRDRHQHVGKGEIGEAAFRRIMNDPQMRDIPMVLEIPGGVEAYREDIRLLRSLINKG